MKTLVWCLMLITAWVPYVNAQESPERFLVYGTISDKDNNPLVGATTVLLEPSDSIMAGYSITNSEGYFQIRNIPSGEYIMQIAYLGFVNTSRKVTVSGLTNLGEFLLIEDSHQLDAVEITADHIPIMIKKDTIEYNSAAFSTQINDKVEELLRQLPGVEVEEDGTIKAQGEEVEKILVDGKEFFGDDPQIATKNLPAEAIDKVQVFDKLSDLAEFTGIDDGERSKTINLTLKDDHKNGIFGDLTAGYGSDDRHEGKTSLNRFDSKSQMSLLGAINNTNEQNFSIDDYINFSGGLQGLAGGGGRINISIDDIGMTPTNGVTSSQSLGLNYNHDFSKNTFIESNYFFTGIQNKLIQSSERENKIANGKYLSTQNQNSDTDNYSHKLNFRLKHGWKNQDLTLRGAVKGNNGSLTNLSYNETYDTNDVLANTNAFVNQSNGSNFNFSTRALYRARLNSTGRTFVVDSNIGNENDDKEADQRAENTFYSNEQISEFNTVDQFQDQDETILNYGASVTYTEPLGGRKYMSLSYLYAGSESTFSKQFYDQETNGLSTFNAELSNIYSRKFDYHRGGIRYLVSRDKSKITMGLEMQSSSLDGTYDNEISKVRRSFINVLPSIRWSHEFSSSKNLEVSYRTGINAPEVTQLQPFVDNSNPLQQYIGNPDLKAEYRHMFDLNYRLFDMFNFTNLFLSLRGVYTKDRIINSVSINEDFVQVMRPVNVHEDILLNSYASFGTPIRDLGAKINLDINSTYNRGIQFIDEVKNNTDRWINSYDFSIENRKKKVFDLKTGLRLAHNVTKYSENKALNQSFSQVSYYSHFKLSFFKKWTLKTNFDYITYHGDSFSDNATFPLLSAYISRSFMKFDRAQLKLYAFDLLDQNVGINRVNDSNYIEDQRYNTMQRYFIISVIYSLSKFGQAMG